jgi:predicted AAA+ superfamily ATPase
VDIIEMHPMSFREFLVASGETAILNKISKKIPEQFIPILERRYREYHCTGGMPEAVDVWMKTKNMDFVRTVQKNILMPYDSDFIKHAPSR